MFRLIKQLSFWFYIGIGVWIIIFILRRNNLIIPYINSYLTDFISVPMYCYIVEFITNHFTKSKRELQLIDIFSSALYLTLIFEVICPLISDSFVTDIYDVVLYFIGGILYFFVRKKTVNTDKKTY